KALKRDEIRTGLVLLPKQKEEEIEEKATQEKQRESFIEKPSSTVVEDNVQLSEDNVSTNAMINTDETANIEKQQETETVSVNNEKSLKEKQELDAFEKELLQ
uniref:hypothetical protein n=1 Tax=Succinivibrio sp. TaxID=2053619 RepID=UPI00386767AF